MSTKTTEHNKLIATRVPPGDKWTLVDDNKKVTINISSEESQQELAGANF